MSWEDRLLPKGAYTSPSGTRIEFDYEDLARKTNKRTAAFSFTGVNGTYVQSNGHDGRDYPMACIFWGADCDREAEAFENALLEDGEGRLEHPLYGTFGVVPTGEVSRVDKVKTEANQSVVEVTFVDVIGTVYPDAAVDARGTVAAQAETLTAASAQEFADGVDVSTSAGREGLKANVREQLAVVRNAMTTVASAEASVRRELDDALDAIERSLDTLVSVPGELAAAVLEAIQIPAQLTASIRATLAAFVALARGARDLPSATPSNFAPSGGSIASASLTAATNGFHTARLFSVGALSGSSLAAASGDYSARPAAISAATALLEQLDELVAWDDAGFAVLAEVDTGAGYQALQGLVAVTSGYLVRQSFALAAERRITLTRARTILDLAAELYGAVDSQLDRLIADNDLTGDELLELPAGTAVVYYA